MKRLCALVLLPALLTVHCAARGAGPAVRQQDPPELWRSYAAKLTVGSAVRIATIDGDRFNGTLLVVDESGVTVKPTSRVPEPPRHVAYDHLGQLELRSTGDSPGDRAAAIGIGIVSGAAVFFGALLVMFALSSD